MHTRIDAELKGRPAVGGEAGWRAGQHVGVLRQAVTHCRAATRRYREGAIVGRPRPPAGPGPPAPSDSEGRPTRGHHGPLATGRPARRGPLALAGPPPPPGGQPRPAETSEFPLESLNNLRTCDSDVRSRSRSRVKPSFRPTVTRTSQAAGSGPSRWNRSITAAAMKENVPPLVVGMRVLVKNLKNADYYNGLKGQIVELFPSEGRLLIALEGNRQLKLKFENVEVLSNTSPSSTTQEAGAIAQDSGAKSQDADATAGLSCAICYEDFAIQDRAILPCCGTRESTVQYCRRCIEIVIERGIDGNMGRCPTCSTYLVKSGGTFKICEQVAGRCRMCMQQKVIADPNCESILCHKLENPESVHSRLLQILEPRSVSSVCWALASTCCTSALDATGRSGSRIPCGATSLPRPSSAR